MKPYHETDHGTIYQGDALEVLKQLPNHSAHCCVTSPPYWALRDYGIEGQLGLESSIELYISKLCDIFDEVYRVLKRKATLWVNIGDTYAGSGREGRGKQSKDAQGRKNLGNAFKNIDTLSKSLCMIPFRFAIEMSKRGWILRNTIIWHKPNCMPSSAKDRFTVDFEYMFFFVKSKRYYFQTQYEPTKLISLKRMLRGRGIAKHTSGDYLPQGNPNSINQPKEYEGYEKLDEIAASTPGRIKRTVWSISTKSFKEAHFATYPPELIETPIQAGCPPKGTVIDPFFGAGTTGIVAAKQGKKYIGIELNLQYCHIAATRIEAEFNQIDLWKESFSETLDNVAST